MPLRVISYGGGVQSTALAVLNAAGRVENPATVLLFADTGNERPETYQYVEQHFRPWAEAHSLTFVTVRSNYAGGSVYADCWRRRDVPSILSRSCTNSFKVQPINRWLRGHGAAAAEPADIQVAISVDESNRAKPNKHDPSYLIKRWPLCDLRLTRRDCQQVIADAGLPIPAKSACFICPFGNAPYWRYLASQHPALFEQAVALEDRAQERKPNVWLAGDKPLRRLLADGRQIGLDEFLDAEAGCRSGHCFL